MSKKKRKKKEIRIPRFTNGDLDYLIAREFPNKTQEVKNKFSGLNHYGLDLERTMAAILKLAEGDFEKIRGLIKTANADPRDIIAYAETPRSMELDYTRRSEMSEEQKEKMRVEDWTEYKNWQNQGR